MDRTTALSEFFTSLHRASASLLLLDYDGTLAPFHTDRMQAWPWPGVTSVLASIIESARTRVVLISGRPAEEVRALVQPLSQVEIWGAHGMERMHSDGRCERSAVSEYTQRLLDEAKEEAFDAGLGLHMEIKPGGLAMHWRGLSDAEAQTVEAKIRHRWSPLSGMPQLRLLPFEAGIEIRVAHPDKGDAVAEILRTMPPDAPVAYLGDDLTDEDAFVLLKDRGLTVLVRSQYRPTQAATWLRPPEDLIHFLQEWQQHVSAEQDSGNELRAASGM